MGLNINDIAASAYDILQNVQQQATEMLGMDAMYFRAVPNANSEDAVIFQEYTLYNVEDCGQQLKVLMSDTSYQGGDYTAGLFGVEFQPIPEAQMPITEWQARYPQNTQPQKGDIIYIQILNKLYEVTSATVVYTAGERPMYFKMSLKMYAPQASRRENEELRQTIEDMTVSQEELFGETISQEVADTVVEVETAYNTTSTVDPMKEFDISSIVIDELVGPAGVRISNAYYDMLTAQRNVVYHTPATYSPESERPYWLFACWFRYADNQKKKEHPLRKITYFTQDAKYQYFRLETPLKLKDGDVVSITKGTLISVTGEITNQFDECETAPIAKIPLAEIQLMERKLKDWNKTGPFKIQKSAVFSVIRSDNQTFEITVNPTNPKIKVHFGNFIKEVAMTSDTSFGKWTYMMAGLTNNNMHLFVEQLQRNEQTGYTETNVIYNKEVKANVKKAGEFAFETLEIPCNGSAVNLRNIRLYESEYEMTDDIAERDALTEITENASKLIVVDAPNIAQKGDFYSPAR